MKSFSVTFETYTLESVANGGANERGYLAEKVSLREAVSELLDLGALDHIEPSDSTVERARWFTAYQGSDAPLYYNGEGDCGETRSLHVPESATAASRRRLARVLGCRMA